MLRGRKRHSIIIAINLALSAVMLVVFLTTSYSSLNAASNNPTVLGKVEIKRPNYSNALLNETVQNINNLREQNDLPKLGQSQALDALAQKRAADMQTNGYYAHKDPSGKFFSDYLKEQGYIYSYACENLNISSSPSSDYFINSWLASTAGHKECMLHNSHRSAGYAITTIPAINGVQINETVIVAIYSDNTELQ